MSGFTLHMQWRSALAAESQAYNFPNRFTRYFRERYSTPAVYRWRVMGRAGETKEKVYIGEAEDLIKRIQRVLTPKRQTKKGDTNKRLNALFSEQVAQGRAVVLDVADIEPFEVNGIRFDREAVGDRFKRRALENLLLVIAEASNQYELLNVTIDPVDKVRKALAKLPPSKLREIIKKYGIDTKSPELK